MSARRDVPQDFEVLVELPGLAEVLGEALGVKPEDPSGAIAALEARQRLQGLPLAEFKLAAPLPLAVRHTDERFTGARRPPRGRGRPGRRLKCTWTGAATRGPSCPRAGRCCW